MSNNRGLWLLSTLVTAGAVLCGRMDWCSALIGLAVAFALYALSGPGRLPGFFRAVQALWLAVPLGFFAGAAADLFPDAANAWYVPAVVLALSWLAARQGAKCAAAASAVAGFFVLGAVGIVAVFSLPELRLSWLAPRFDPYGALTALAMGAAGFTLAEAFPGQKPKVLWRIAAFAAPAVLCALVSGSLSPELAARQASAFYTLSRSISVFGVAERFEALISACLCLGVLGACTMLLCAVRALSGERSADGISAALSLAALAGCSITRYWVVFLLGTVILWVLLPLAKISKNMKKSIDKSDA